MIGATPPESGGLVHRGENRRMLPIYVAVLAVEVLTLLGLWWFQTVFLP